MNIGIFNPYLDSLAGGEKYMLTLSQCLSSAYHVSLFWNPQEQQLIREQAQKRFNIDLTKVEFVDNIFSKDVSFFTRFRKTKQYDEIIVLSDGSIPIISKKLILHFQFPIEWVRGKSFINQLKIQRVYKIICNSEFTKSYIDKTFNVKSEVLYPPATMFTKKDKENMILHVGRFGLTVEGSNFKKQDMLIDSFKRMVDKGLKNWKFVLVVSVRDEDKDKLQNLRDRAKSYPIEFAENINMDKMTDYYGKAKVYWHASGFGEDLHKHPERAEHFGISTVEAMSAAAVPVVINAGGQPEIVKDKVNGFLWKTENELMEKTQTLIDDPKMLSKLSAHAQESAKRFSKEKFCGQAVKIVL